MLGRLLDTQATLDGLAQGVLIFDSNSRLVLANKAQGWVGAAAYFDRLFTDDATLNGIRNQALKADRPIRFQIYPGGELIPCWASAVHGSGGEMFLMITLDTPDWSGVNSVLHLYLQEVDQAVEAANGHAELIQKSLQNPKATQSLEQLSRRVGGFARIISIQMYRLNALTNLMARLNSIRSGGLRDTVAQDVDKIVLSDFFEEFLETLDAPPLVDPETSSEPQRGRVKRIVPPHLSIFASRHYFELILRDLLRNALMYSMRGTEVRIVVFASSGDSSVQIDVTDEGYGIRSSEHDRVFMPFERARQPQIISEFGYGLSLYLCKHEIEAMNGQLWFESHEGGGSTFSLRLPAWRDG
jgi:signal transduction histidine kinase